MKYEIQLKVGIGDIKFDMPIEDVVARCGEADEVETIDNATDETTTILRYANGDITLFFEGENPTLTCIDTCDGDLTLFGKELFELTEKEIVQLMVANNYFEQDVDVEDWGERRVTFNEANVDFYFENDELVSVLLGK